MRVLGPSPLSKPPTLDEILHDNDVLKTHPMMAAAFIQKGCRKVPWKTSDIEFKELYAIMEQSEKDKAAIAPHHVSIDWTYPPGCDRIKHGRTYSVLPASVTLISDRVF